MSKHKKKQQKQQRNLSLKERLGRHWDNRNWDLFVALFSRDREASMRTPLAARWNDALYNSLTKALFIDKNLENAEATLSLVNAERSAFGISGWLEDCSAVASDFLTAHKNAFLKETSPLKEESGLPAVYAGLRKGLASFVSSPAKERSTKNTQGAQKAQNSQNSQNSQKTRKNDAAALIEKFAAQYAKLGRAKTVMPYTTWLKTAEQLESLTKGTENERVFSAVRAITALTRELFLLTGRGANSLREPGALPGSKLFLSVPRGQTHPAVKALWGFFCRAGEQKYGAEWGDAARLAQLYFMADEDQRELKAQYDGLVKSGHSDIAHLALALIQSSSAWTEQELYVLNTIFVSFFDGSGKIDLSMRFSIVKKYLNAFGVLAGIGRKWRPEAPWVKSVEESFERLLHNCPVEFISSDVQVPYDAVSPYSLVMLSLMDGRYLKPIEKAVPRRLPLHLNEDDVNDLVIYLAGRTSHRDTIHVLNSLAERADNAAVMKRLALKVIGDGAAKRDGQRLSWEGFCRSGFPEETAKLLAKDDFVGCFCGLCSNVPPYHISSEQPKIEACFSALQSETQDNGYADFFLTFLLTWPEIAPEFLVRLFEKSNLFRDGFSTSKWGDGSPWLSLAAQVESIPNEANRAAIALGILNLTAWRRRKKFNASFKKAMEILERLGGVRPKKTAASGKAKQVLQEMTGQGTLPFEENKV